MHRIRRSVDIAEIRHARTPPPRSILGLLDGDGKVASATDRDISFLKATYSIPPARAGWKQRRMLVGKMMEDGRAASQIDEDLTEGLSNTHCSGLADRDRLLDRAENGVLAVVVHINAHRVAMLQKRRGHGTGLDLFDHPQLGYAAVA